MMQKLCANTWTRSLPVPEENFWFGLHSFYEKGKSMCSEQWQKCAEFYLDWYNKSAKSLEPASQGPKDQLGWKYCFLTLFLTMTHVPWAKLSSFQCFMIFKWTQHLSVYLPDSLKHTWFAKYLRDEKGKYLTHSETMTVFSQWLMKTCFLSLKMHTAFSMLEAQNGCPCIAVKEKRHQHIFLLVTGFQFTQ